MKNKSCFRKMASRTALALVAFSMQAAFAATTNVNVGGATLTFNPAIITINVGDTIVWANQGGFHTVTGTGAEPMCGPGALAATCSHKFMNAGSFAYQCNFHAA